MSRSSPKFQSGPARGKERDTETGNDDFGARYYSARLGRWLFADWSAVPEAVPYANLSNPQTLNLYAMVSDNPETSADLDGHCPSRLGMPVDCGEIAAMSGVEGGRDLDDQILAQMQLRTLIANGQGLSEASEDAILNSPLTGPEARAFEEAVLNAAQQTGIDPNVLVGMASQESSLGAKMNPHGAAKGLFGIEQTQMVQLNKMFKSGLRTSDLLSLKAGSMAKVSLAVAEFLQRYSSIYSKSSDPRGIDAALSAWRVGVGQTSKNILQGNFWDYIDLNLHESVAHYVDTVEGFQ